MSNWNVIPYIRVKTPIKSIGKVTVSVDSIKGVFDSSSGIVTTAIIKFKGQGDANNDLTTVHSCEEILKAMNHAVIRANVEGDTGLVVVDAGELKQIEIERI